jgi:hypothetical protein
MVLERRHRAHEPDARHALAGNARERQCERGAARLPDNPEALEAGLVDDHEHVIGC